MSVPDGYYNGEIIEVDYEEDDFNTTGIVACLTVELDEPHEKVVCRHRSHGDHADKTLDVLEHLGLPRDVKAFVRLGECVGRETRVRVKTSEKGRQNAYLVTRAAPKKMSLSDVKRRLDGGDLPF